MRSALYAGVVMHSRLRPRRHRLRYRVFSLLLDLEELPVLNRLRLFGHNRAAPLSFYDRDHGAGDGDLKAWVATQLADAGIRLLVLHLAAARADDAVTQPVRFLQ